LKEAADGSFPEALGGERNGSTLFGTAFGGGLFGFGAIFEIGISAPFKMTSDSTIAGIVAKGATTGPAWVSRIVGSQCLLYGNEVSLIRPTLL
jgi:uncharacterized repeat protein (TIGR03803 family)